MGALRRGLSLTEAVVALFLLTGATLVMVRLFHTSLGYSTRSNQEVLAARVAQRHLEALRWLATQPGGYASLVTLYGAPVTATDLEDSGFEVTVWAANEGLARSPSTELEAVHPGNEKVFDESLTRVSVTVLSGAQQRAQLATLVGEPRRPEPFTVTITEEAGFQNPMPTGATNRFTVELVDGNGDVIPDVVFSWSVLPVDGFGHISGQARDGTWCEFTNQLSTGVGNKPGRCKVEVNCVYWGDDYSAESAEMDLQ